jgi:hypothetical protein
MLVFTQSIYSFGYFQCVCVCVGVCVRVCVHVCVCAFVSVGVSVCEREEMLPDFLQPQTEKGKSLWHAFSYVMFSPCDGLSSTLLGQSRLPL